jgi:hypothetical protein
LQALLAFTSHRHALPVIDQVAHICQTWSILDDTLSKEMKDTLQQVASALRVPSVEPLTSTAAFELNLAPSASDALAKLLHKRTAQLQAQDYSDATAGAQTRLL